MANPALTLPEADEAWLEAFSDSLFVQLNYYDMQLIGGDTTRGPLSMTLGIHGYVPTGRALKRSGAKHGDWIYVTGTPGDSAAGLAILQDRLQVEDDADADYLWRAICVRCRGFCRGRRCAIWRTPPSISPTA